MSKELYARWTPWKETVEVQIANEDEYWDGEKILEHYKTLKNHDNRRTYGHAPDHWSAYRWYNRRTPVQAYRKCEKGEWYAVYEVVGISLELVSPDEWLDKDAKVEDEEICTMKAREMLRDGFDYGDFGVVEG